MLVELRNGERKLRTNVMGRVNHVTQLDFSPC